MDASDFYGRKYNSIYRGIVEDNVDPKHLGRCKIRVPSIHGELNYPASALPWARPIVLSPTKKDRGSINLPDIGDIVWVFFEGSEKEFPVFFGGTYAIGELDINQDIVDIYMEDNNKISYDRASKIWSINIGDIKLIINNTDITLIGDTKVYGDLRVSGSISTSGDMVIGGSLVVHGSATIPSLNER